MGLFADAMMAINKRGEAPVSDWYWLHPDRSISPAPTHKDKEGFAAYSAWLYGTDENGRLNKLVERTEIADDIAVSMVFLGLDHSFGGPGPVVFESLVFGGPYDGEMDRYQTYEQALSGHKRLVDKHKKLLAKRRKNHLSELGKEYDEAMAAQELLKLPAQRGS